METLMPITPAVERLPYISNVVALIILILSIISSFSFSLIILDIILKTHPHIKNYFSLWTQVFEKIIYRVV